MSPQGDRIDTSTEFPIIQPKTWEEYLTLAQNSTELAWNMKNDGYGVRQKGYAAHHIIPATAKGAEAARKILKKYGIGINDSINGVYLPTTDMRSANGIKHSGKHPDDYVNNINNRIIYADNNGSKHEVIKELQNIRNILQNANGSDSWRNII